MEFVSASQFTSVINFSILHCGRALVAFKVAFPFSQSSSTADRFVLFRRALRVALKLVMICSRCDSHFSISSVPLWVVNTGNINKSLTTKYTLRPLMCSLSIVAKRLAIGQGVNVLVKKRGGSMTPPAKLKGKNKV